MHGKHVFPAALKRLKSRLREGLFGIIRDPTVQLCREHAGLVPKTDLLQAQIDLNVYLENAIDQETVIIAAKRTLNQLISRNIDTPFEVEDSIRNHYIPDNKELETKLRNNLSTEEHK